jgi:hypothetical protein
MSGRCNPAPNGCVLLLNNPIMKKAILPFLLVLAGLLLCVVQTSLAQIIVLPIAGITGVSAGGNLELEIEKGDYELRIHGDSDALKSLEIAIEDGMLEIKSTRRMVGMQVHSVDKIVIQLPALENLKLTGASSATIRGFDHADMFIMLTGASEVVGEKINVGAVKFDLSGAVSAEIKGSAQTVVANITGASSFDAEKYKVTDMTLTISGAGQADVAVSDKLFVTINGVGRVNLHTKPETLVKRINGAGRIEEDF